MRKFGLILIISIFFLTGCGNLDNSTTNQNNYNTNNNSENNSNSNQSISVVIDIHDIKDNFYNNYINKKVTITNIPVKYVYGDYTVGTLAVGIKCDNQSSLNLTDNSTISITGTISSSTTSNTYIRMSNCSIN